MTSQEIKNLTLNYELTEELLKECLEEDFRKTIIGVLNALYELLISYNKNKTLVNSILVTLESLAKEEQNIKNIKIFHGEIKNLTTNIHRQLKPEINHHLSPIVRQLQAISRRLKQTMIETESSEKIKTLETIIESSRNLKIIANLIRENKNILKIKDASSENILYKLLVRYASLEETAEEEINYLYQVISLFINSDDTNIEIIRNADYYISALGNSKSKHVKQIKEQLEVKKQPISLSELENRYQIYTTYSSEIESELNTFKMIDNGAIDLTSQHSFTIDGEDSLCLDDSIYLKRLKDGSYILFVNITRIPALIPYDSEINRESIRRVETYYLSDAVYSLYPEYISNYLASLLPNNIRYTETGLWRIEPNLTLVEDSFKLIKTTTMSHHRLTYESADEIIGQNSKDELSKTLSTLGAFALKQRKKNKAKEKYRELENLQSNNPNHESKLANKYVAANIVQECALLFNHSKGGLYKKEGKPYIFRACGKYQSLSLEGDLLKHYASEKEHQVLEMTAYYTATPEKHHGLDYDPYCHGGSPGRRSPDGQNQYIDEDLIFTNPSDKTVYMWEERTKELVAYYNETVPRIEAFSNQYNYLTSKKLIRKP